MIPKDIQRQAEIFANGVVCKFEEMWDFNDQREWEKARNNFTQGAEFGYSLASPKQEQEAVGFADWKDGLMMKGKILRLKDEKVKWFYNHKSAAKIGEQDWVAYTTEQLYEIYKSLHHNQKPH